MDDVINKNIYEPEEGEIQNLKKSKRKRKKKSPKIVKIENKSKQICKYWMNGRCEKGDTCSFSHAEIPDKISERSKTEQICKYELRGGCLNENCLFSHDK